MVPGLLGLLGSSGVGLAVAPALQVLVLPLVAVGGALLFRAWWLQITHGIRTKWQWRSLATLAAATALVIVLWSLRFAGVLS